VDDLEHSNKELMRFIDKKNYQDAADYKNRVTELLSRPRGSQEAVLRQPPSIMSSKPTAGHTREPSAMLASYENPMLHSMAKNKSQSPTKRAYPPKSIETVALENPSHFHEQRNYSQPSLTPPAEAKRLMISTHVSGSRNNMQRNS